MKIVPQIISTGRPTVTIKDAEEAYLRPLNLQISFVFRLENIQYDTDSVLIVVSDDPLVGVGGI